MAFAYSLFRWRLKVLTNLLQQEEDVIVFSWFSKYLDERGVCGVRTISHATYVMQRVRIYCSRGRLCQGTFTLMPGDGYKMVLCPHSGYAIVFRPLCSVSRRHFCKRSVIVCVALPRNQRKTRAYRDPVPTWVPEYKVSTSGYNCSWIKIQ